MDSQPGSTQYTLRVRLTAHPTPLGVRPPNANARSKGALDLVNEADINSSGTMWVGSCPFTITFVMLTDFSEIQSLDYCSLRVIDRKWY